MSQSAKCDACEESATVHLVTDGGKHEVHLCRSCAEKRHVVAAATTTSLNGIASSIALAGPLADLVRGECPDCGIKFMQFRRLGRLGCPNDYTVFRLGLIPLLDRVQAAVQHRGKRPRHTRIPAEAFRELRQLRRQLRLAVSSDDFDEARRLKDVIRAKAGCYGS